MRNSRDVVTVITDNGPTGVLALVGAALLWMVGGTLTPPHRRATDATWFEDGTKWTRQPYFSGRKPPKRHLRAGWKKAVRRCGTLAVMVATTYGAITRPLLTGWVVVVVSSVVVGLAADLAYRRARGRKHFRHVVRPLHDALAPVVGLDPLVTEPRSWLRVPRTYRTSSGPVATVLLPASAFAGDDDDEGGFRSGRASLRGALEGVVLEKLGLTRGEIRVTYRMTGRTPSAEFRHMPAVPGRVTVKEIAELLRKARETAPLLGLTRGREPVAVDLDAEAPHIMLSMGPGAGKSVCALGVAAQILHNAGRVLVIDVKRTSQKPIKDHPFVRYMRDPEDIHNELVFLGGEILRRQRISDDDENAYVGPRVLVIVEERNALVEMLRSWWAENKPKGAPAQSPALTALNNLGFMGREPKMHVLSIAQYGDARTMGGGSGRENYGCRILGRASRNAWRMLAPEVTRIPRKTTKRGRVHVVLGESPVETQIVLWSVEEARAWAWACFPDGLAHRADRLSREDFYQGATTVTVTPAAVETMPGVNPANHAICAPTDGPEDAAERGPAEASSGPLSVDEVTAWSAIIDGYAQTADDAARAGNSARGDGGESSSSAGGVVVPQREPVALPEAMTLRDAVEAGVVRVSPDVKKALMILRQARQRDPEFPRPVRIIAGAHLYAPGDLAAWARNRERGGEQ